jgi:hypothetical protein
MKRKTVNYIGVEIEFRQLKNSDTTKLHGCVSEYYNNMKEINNILIPTRGDVKSGILSISALLKNINNKLGRTIGTSVWRPSYGNVYNGLHIHLDGKHNKALLEHNLLQAVHKIGITPRIATSWHIRKVRSSMSLKRKDKYRPVIYTKYRTTEIRLLDIEYFYDRKSTLLVADAIEKAINDETVDYGYDVGWFYSNDSIDVADRWLDVLDRNKAHWITKVDKTTYLNRYNNDVVNFSPFVTRDYVSLIDVEEVNNPSLMLPRYFNILPKVPTIKTSKSSINFFLKGKMLDYKNKAVKFAAKKDAQYLNGEFINAYFLYAFGCDIECVVDEQYEQSLLKELQSLLENL